MPIHRQASVALLLCAAACATSTQSIQPRPIVTTASAFYSEAFDSLAVLVRDQSPGRIDRGLIQQIQDKFVSAAIRHGFSVASVSDRDRLIEELEFQRSGWTDRDAVDIGRMLNVRAVLLVTIDYAGSERSDRALLQHLYEASAKISGRLLSVRTSEVLWLGTFSRSGLADEQDAMAIHVAESLSSTLPSARSRRPAEAEQVSTPRGPFQSSDRFVIAVEDLTRDLWRDSLRQVEDEAIRQLLEEGFRVPARSDTVSILDELEFQRSGFSDRDLVEAGRLLNATHFLVLSINKINVEDASDKYKRQVLGTLTVTRAGYDVDVGISARVIDIRENRILTVSSHEDEVRIPNEDLVPSAVAEVAGKLVRRIALTLAANRTY